jgi:hypothetical protein
MSSDHSDGEDNWNDSGSNGTPVESLVDKIVTQLEESVFDNDEFLPDGCIDRLITREAVMSELALTQEDLKKGSNATLLNFILKKGKLIFAILLVSGFHGTQLANAVTQFGKNKMGDSSLPITEDLERSTLFFGSWSKNLRHEFLKKQWAFLSPVFSKERKNLELHPKIILPFTRQENSVKSGAFGEVHQVTVHESHHKDPVLTVRISLSHPFLHFMFIYLKFD